MAADGLSCVKEASGVDDLQVGLIMLNYVKYGFNNFVKNNLIK